eukprot:TRINITY_DN4163_c0_g2_i1.p1 TRINITY_DN4163_c0_g2~~TRINITY_DN4163_c0_g2_i1.p1  ORF type:complete len:536 (+),score=164.98 TRINITY_DN4163_c0_g2_i1:50-1609(+)
MTIKTAIEIGSGLADSGDENEDASKWVERMQRESKKKKKNQKKLQNAFDELDDAVATEATNSGMKVMHSLEQMESALEGGTTQILTLKDTRLLDRTGRKFNDDADEDILENVHLTEAEKRAFNKRASKKSNVYSDDEEDDDGAILPQYSTSRTDFEKSRKFTTLNSEGDINVSDIKQQREQELDAKAAAEGKTRYSFQDEFTYGGIMNDTFNEEELATFRKPKKKKMVRKRREKQPDEALKQLETELQETTTTKVKKTKIERDQLEVMEKLERRARIQEEVQKESEELRQLAEERIQQQQQEEEQPPDDASTYVIDTTTEFTHGIGSVFSSKLEDLKAEAKETEEHPVAPKKPVEEDLTPEQLAQQEERMKMLRGIKLLDEARTDTIAGTLEYIKQKGLLENSLAGRANDKVLQRDTSSGINVSMTDSQGREQTIKQQFREHSHIFHNKKPSKKQQARNERRFSELDALQKMSVSDTALGGAASLRQAQAASGQAGIVMDGFQEKRPFTGGGGEIKRRK